ncbi:MAG: hypothetical protein LUG99_22295 [Lachnospiraceae bacterium]|nr:hypothetical protein [Lachnospiraceae bacterium]
MSSGTETGTVKKGLVQEGSHYYYYKNDGTMLKNKWKTIGSYRYYFKDNGRAAIGGYKIGDYVYVFDGEGHLLTGKKSRFVTVNGSVYYVNKKGRASTGWFIVNKHLYRANAKGKQVTTEKDGITFTKKGYAKDNIASRLKMLTMEIVDDITTDKMTKKQKLKVCWEYMTTKSNWTYKTYEGSVSTLKQRQKCAYDMLSSGRGSCRSFACAFAALATEVGYKAYVIMGRVPGSRDQAADGYTKHSWVRINGRYFDPEGVWAGWNTTSGYNEETYSIPNIVLNILPFF